MSEPILRLRNQLMAMIGRTENQLQRSTLAVVVAMLDEEVDKGSEIHFLKPINPNPITKMAKELKETNGSNERLGD
jgi:hypothetical protein